MDNNKQLFQCNTTINCDGCVASSGITKEQIIKTVKEAGFSIKPAGS